MPQQDSQGRKLLYMMSIVANLPITEVEGHYPLSDLPRAAPRYGADYAMISTWSGLHSQVWYGHKAVILRLRPMTAMPDTDLQPALKAFILEASPLPP